MINHNKLIPTEPYPRLLWYQEKCKFCTPEERKILFKRFFNVIYNRLIKKYPTTDHQTINKLASEQANIMLEKEINAPTILKKVVVNNIKEHRLTKEMISSSINFLKWYQD